MIRILILYFAFSVVNGFAQSDTITLSGTVYDVDNKFIRISYFVVNKRTNKGVFGNYKGDFQLKASKRDSIIISAKDYYPVRIAVKDSCRGSLTCSFRVGLRKKEIQLMSVDILPIRDHSAIAKEIKDLVEPKSIELVTADGLTSPITALYQAFSKIERSKHAVRVLEAEDRKRDVLKELLAKYVKADIIDLDEEQFDDFLNVAEFNTDYLQTLSDYHLIKYVQYRYESYIRISEFYNVFKRVQRNDYELALMEAKGEKMTLLTNLFKQYIDKNIWQVRSYNPEVIFEFINFASFNTAELLEMNDYAMIVTVKRKYDQFMGNYGTPGNR